MGIDSLEIYKFSLKVVYNKIYIVTKRKKLVQNHFGIYIIFYIFNERYLC